MSRRSIGLIAILLLAGGGSEAGARTLEARRIEAIQAQVKKCKEALGEYPGTTELQQCDFDAWKNARKLVRRSKGNPLLDKLWPDLFEVLVYYLAGDDALAMRVVVAAGGTDFELKRVGILSGATLTASRRKYSDADVLQLLKKVRRSHQHFAKPGTLAGEWKAVRNADCAAYQVANCSGRLNAAFAAMIQEIISEGQ